MSAYTFLPGGRGHGLRAFAGGCQLGLLCREPCDNLQGCQRRPFEAERAIAAVVGIVIRAAHKLGELSLVRGQAAILISADIAIAFDAIGHECRWQLYRHGGHHLFLPSRPDPR